MYRLVVFLIAKELQERNVNQKFPRKRHKNHSLDLTSGFASGDRHHILHLVTGHGADIDSLDFYYYCYLGKFVKEVPFGVSCRSTSRDGDYTDLILWLLRKMTMRTMITSTRKMSHCCQYRDAFEICKAKRNALECDTFTERTL